MKKIIFIFVSLLTILSASITNDPKEDFLDRLYITVLNREPDIDGLNYWLDKWNRGEANAKSIAKSFMHSQEFLSKDLDDIDFLYTCYEAFMGREPDDDGLNYWLDRLYSGTSRDEVIDSFIDSAEFQNIIGSADSNSLDDPVRDFVVRLYRTILGREPDSAGLNNWVNQIKSGAMDYKSVAMSFMHSPEFLSKDLDEFDFVDTLYRAFLGREPDSDGEYYWVDKLYSGVDRDSVISSFINSQEFQNIINGASSNPNPNPAPPISTDEQMLLNEHNRLRSELYLDSPMVWDSNLAQASQDYANYLAQTGLFEHSGGMGYGENLALTYSDTPYQDALYLWESEAPYYDYYTNSCASGKVCGHYTQMIWRDSTHLGCGKAIYQTGEYRGAWVIVCRYTPAGNIIGQRPY